MSLWGGTSKAEFEALAEVRIREARALLAAGELDGARYLAGYAVECALKAIITKEIIAQSLPSKKSVADVHTHDLQTLLGLSGAKDDVASSREVLVSWEVVRTWNEQLRYLRGANAADTKALLDAIDGPRNGVLPWLMQRW